MEIHTEFLGAQIASAGEKHGWMGDALDASEQALYNFQIGPVHDAFLQTIEDNQGGNGDVPVVVPGDAGSTCNDIAWTSAYPQITMMQYQYYADKRVLQQKWQSLVRYQENLIAYAEGKIHRVDPKFAS